MFEKDNEIKFYALNMWANHIETGNVSMSAEDAHKRNEKVSLKYLDENQQKFVIRLRELARKELSGK